MEFVTYWCTSRFVQDNKRIIHGYNSRFPVNFITPDQVQAWKSGKNEPSKDSVQLTYIVFFFFFLPWKTFRMHVHTQECPGLNKLVCICYPVSLLSFSYRLPSNGRPSSQSQRRYGFFKHLHLLWGRAWRRLRMYKGVMYSSKPDKICNKPFEESKFLTYYST